MVIINMFNMNGATEDISVAAVQRIARWFFFLDDQHFRIVNSEGVDCFIAWSNNFKIMTYTKFINRLTGKWKDNKVHPLLDANPGWEDIEVLPRIVRRCHHLNRAT